MRSTPKIPQDSLVKRALIFSANPTVRRVIFVATPHRGSSLATGGIGALGTRLIRLSLRVESAITNTMRAALAPNNDPREYRAPTSIFDLSPKNPLLVALDMAGPDELYPNGGLFGTGFKMWGLDGTRRVLIEYTKKVKNKHLLLDPVDIKKDLYGFVYAPERNSRGLYNPFPNDICVLPVVCES